MENCENIVSCTTVIKGVALALGEVELEVQELMNIQQQFQTNKYKHNAYLFAPTIKGELAFLLKPRYCRLYSWEQGLECEESQVNFRS